MIMTCVIFLASLQVVTIVITPLVAGSLDCNHINFYVSQNDSVNDDDVEHRTEMHDPAWPASMSLVAQNFTTLTIQWKQPLQQAIDSLCTFGVHYYPLRDVKQLSSHVTIYVPKKTTEMMIKNLQMGTTYHVYVEAVFDQEIPTHAERIQTLKSALVSVMTKGIGPDNACNCNPFGTKVGYLDKCDQYTGKCQCKVEGMTNNLKCDACVEHSYMDELMGCSECDDCNPNGSTGSCFPAKGGGMSCECKGNYLGKHCRDCQRGYYPGGKICEPCKCEGNGDEAADLYCKNSRTCTASCVSHATGDKCTLLCLPGFVGNATGGECHVEIPVSHAHQAGVAVLVIVIIVLLVVLFVIILRARRSRDSRRNKPMQATMRGNGGVDFSALVEEPDQMYDRGSDKSPIALIT